MASNNKIAKIDEMNDDNKDLMQIIENIDNVQTELDGLNEKASDEILTVEQKYNVLRKPHFEKRQELFSKIPDFWVKAFINHPQLNTMLTDKDAEIIQYLQTIEVQDYDDVKSGFKIIFTFKKNGIFRNTTLVKDFNTCSELGQVVKGTEIDWIKDPKKEAKNGGDRKRAAEEEESFFEWFADESDASNDEIAEIIKEDLWSNPMNFFLGGEEDFEDEEGGEGEEEEEEDSEEEDE